MTQFEHVCFKNTAVFYTQHVHLHVQAHVNEITAVFQHCPELGAVVSWQYKMYYQLPTGSGIVPLKQRGSLSGAG